MASLETSLITSELENSGKGSRNFDFYVLIYFHFVCFKAHQYFYK